MLLIWLYSIFSVIIISLVSLVGAVTLTIDTEKLKKVLIFFVSFSAGSLLGGAFLHLLPKAVESFGYTTSLAFWLIGGIFIFFILEKFIHWRHCHEPTSETHPHHLGKMNLIGDGLHNFIDGLIIASAYLVSLPVGVAATLAIVFHEIPQEISDFGVLLHSGYTKVRAIMFNLLSASLAIVGVVIGLLLSGLVDQFTAAILPLAAAGFIYIATADLIPEIHKTTKMSKSIMQIIMLIFGVLTMYLLTFLE